MDSYAKLTDEAVVQLVRSKNKEAYAAIIKRYKSKLLRYAAFLVGSDAIAADVVQDSFIKAYINLNGFDTKKQFSSWIYRIVHNEAMNVLHRQKRSQPIDETMDFDSGVDIEDDFIRSELTSMTHDCLLSLPVMYREPVTLYYLDDKTYEEISTILRIPVGTVGTRISRAKAQLKKICQRK
jgi:RNA polymerase sigma-70 factor (ECF subfamily)